MAVQVHQVSFLRDRELGLLAAKTTFGHRYGHSFACPNSDQIGLELRDYPEHVEQRTADGVARILDAAAEAERPECVALRGEILGFGGDAGVTDEHDSDSSV